MTGPSYDDAPPRPRAGGPPDRGRNGRQQQRGAATRHALLVAAGEHFALHGYHATSLNDLLSQGPGKGALYFHFPSKHAVATALVEEMTASWDHVVPTAERDAPDPLHALIAVTDIVVARLDDPIVRGAARVLRDQVLHRPTLAELSAGWEADLARLFTLAAERHLLKPAVEPQWAAHEADVSLAGRATLLESLSPKQELWDQMNQFWTGFLPLITTTAWRETWDAKSWPARPRPPTGLDR